MPLEVTLEWKDGRTEILAEQKGYYYVFDDGPLLASNGME